MYGAARNKGHGNQGHGKPGQDTGVQYIPQTRSQGHGNQGHGKPGQDTDAQYIPQTRNHSAHGNWQRIVLEVDVSIPRRNCRYLPTHHHSHPTQPVRIPPCLCPLPHVLILVLDVRSHLHPHAHDHAPAAALADVRYPRAYRHFRDAHSDPTNIALHLFGLVVAVVANFALLQCADEYVFGIAPGYVCEY